MEDPLGGKGARPSPSQMYLPVSHVDTLESRIREELIALGLFEPQEVCVRCCVYVCISIPLLPLCFFAIIISHLLSQQKKSEGDEILEELQKKQSELKAVVSPGHIELQSILLARFDGLVFTAHYYTSFPSLSPSV